MANNGWTFSFTRKADCNWWQNKLLLYFYMIVFYKQRHRRQQSNKTRLNIFLPTVNRLFSIWLLLIYCALPTRLFEQIHFLNKTLTFWKSKKHAFVELFTATTFNLRMKLSPFIVLPALSTLLLNKRETKLSISTMKEVFCLPFV